MRYSEAWRTPRAPTRSERASEAHRRHRYGRVDKPKAPAEKDASAVELGRRGGQKGGRARADKLSPEQRTATSLRTSTARTRRWCFGSRTPARAQERAFPAHPDDEVTEVAVDRRPAPSGWCGGTSTYGERARGASEGASGA